MFGTLLFSTMHCWSLSQTPAMGRAGSRYRPHMLSSCQPIVTYVPFWRPQTTTQACVVCTSYSRAQSYDCARAGLKLCLALSSPKPGLSTICFLLFQHARHDVPLCYCTVYCSHCKVVPCTVAIANALVVLFRTRQCSQISA